MRPGIWQHRNCTDLQLDIFKVSYRGPDYCKVRAWYVRKDFGWGRLLLDPALDTLTIRKEQYHNWRYVGYNRA